MSFPPPTGVFMSVIYMDFYSHSLEDNATTENDDDEGSIDSWAEEIINTDLPIIYHLIGELKKTQERLKKIAVKHSKRRKKRLVIQEP